MWQGIDWCSKGCLDGEVANRQRMLAVKRTSERRRMRRHVANWWGIHGDLQTARFQSKNRGKEEQQNRKQVLLLVSKHVELSTVSSPSCRRSVSLYGTAVQARKKYLQKDMAQRIKAKEAELAQKQQEAPEGRDWWGKKYGPVLHIARINSWLEGGK